MRDMLAKHSVPHPWTQLTPARIPAPVRKPAPAAPTKPLTGQCECGNPIYSRPRYPRDACDACIQLDGDDRGHGGGSPNAPLVIATIRSLGPLTITELAEELHIAPESVLRCAQRMMAEGRLDRYEEEFEFEQAMLTTGQFAVRAEGASNTTRGTSIRTTTSRTLTRWRYFLVTP